MTRILYWNIENFGINKIANPNARKRKRGATDLTEADASTRRRDIINEVIGAAKPQVIVIVELESAPFIGAGVLSTHAGTDGAAALSAEVANVVEGTWAVIPPLQTGPTEAVAVMYETTNRYFAGPFVWPGGTGPAVPPGNRTGSYPAPYFGWVPSAPVPAHALHNANAVQNRCAARTTFTYRAGHRQAGAPFQFPAYARAPYMVSLYESAGGGRNLTLFGIHAPSGNPVSAAQYLQDLSDIAEIVDNVAVNEVRLVIGDFNVQLLDPALAEDPAYGHLQNPNSGYMLALKPVSPPPAAPGGYAGYFATHIRSQYKAKGWSSRNRVAYYPGYRYVGSDHGPPSAAIDNAFYRYGANFQPPPEPRATNVTIMNPVVGTPLNVVRPPSGGAWPGAVVLQRRMTVPPWPAANRPPGAAPRHNPGFRKLFRSWDQYGCIRSTSDHFAIAIDV
jgi:hypothetical protein